MRKIFITIITFIAIISVVSVVSKNAWGKTCFNTNDDPGCTNGWVWTCFPAGTKILMSGGHEKNIEEVKIGDSVMGYDTISKSMKSALVQELDAPIRDHLYKLTFADGTTLRLTSEHPLYTKEGWKSVNPQDTYKDNPNLQVSKLQIGDLVFTKNNTYTKLISMLYIPGNVQTYNLKKVSAYNNFFADSYLAHNKGGGGDGENSGGSTTTVVAKPTATPTPAPVCSPECGANQVCASTNKCVAHANCPLFVQASVGPSTLRPLDQVVVKCNYGKRMDCATVVGAGLINCRYSRYEGTDNIFTCDAGPNAGYYNDTKCVLSATTADKCCAKSTTIGAINIVGTEVNYGQDMVLPFGTYTLSARVYSVISQGKGMRVALICNSDTCTKGTVKNATIASISFPEGTDFADKTISVPLVGTGDDRHYIIGLSVDKGSEGYFDRISLTNAAKKEFVVNGDFANTVTGSVSTKQPTSWGEGDNRIGYYYGSLVDEETVLLTGSTITTTATATTTATLTPTITAGPSPTPGKASAMSLNIKLKLQGVTKKPKTADAITVLVKLDGAAATFATQSKSVSFTVDDAGIWSGKADFDGVPTGGGYKVYIKGPKHIQKKICVNAPTETTGGTYHCGDGAITLAAGANTLDFSKIIQLAGDLPEAAGKQNGIVDAYDTTFIRTNLGSSDAAKAKTGDLNLDGIIDTQDYSMVLQSLSIKFDEE